MEIHVQNRVLSGLIVLHACLTEAVLQLRRLADKQLQVLIIAEILAPEPERLVACLTVAVLQLHRLADRQRQALIIAEIRVPEPEQLVRHHLDAVMEFATVRKHAVHVHQIAVYVLRFAEMASRKAMSNVMITTFEMEMVVAANVQLKELVGGGGIDNKVSYTF